MLLDSHYVMKDGQYTFLDFSSYHLLSLCYTETFKGPQLPEVLYLHGLCFKSYSSCGMKDLEFQVLSNIWMISVRVMEDRLCLSLYRTVNKVELSLRI